jgi:glycosyltransferase involved in cell wall biosynthesis
MPVAMSAADALLLTSFSEGSPNVVKEAMAAELPVIATRVGDVRERLAGVEGCHACQPDPAAMSDALVAAIGRGRSPEAREAVSALSLDAVARRVLAVYEQVLARSASRAA